MYIIQNKTKHRVYVGRLVLESLERKVISDFDYTDNKGSIDLAIKNNFIYTVKVEEDIQPTNTRKRNKKKES